MQTASSLTASPISRQAVFQRASVRPRPAPRSVAVVRASAEVQPKVELPKGVTLPKIKPVRPPATFGFVDNAERLNSRAAMIGFFGILLVEAVTNKALLGMAGFTVGKGLPFEL